MESLQRQLNVSSLGLYYARRAAIPGSHVRAQRARSGHACRRGAEATECGGALRRIASGRGESLGRQARDDADAAAAVSARGIAGRCGPAAGQIDWATNHARSFDISGARGQVAFFQGRVNDARKHFAETMTAATAFEPQLRARFLPRGPGRMPICPSSARRGRNFRA